MAEVWFFEKPGCINNNRQKTLLRQSGHRLHVENLLEYEWSLETLRVFFGELPVVEWFNMTAPAIKQGRVDPAALGQDEALALMLQDPLLIRRPLLRVGQDCRVGFDAERIDKWIGLIDRNRQDDLETCPQQA